MHKSSIDLPATLRKRVIPELQGRLLDAIDLFTQVKQAHWNVKGPNFISLHELFDHIAEEVEEYGDLIAERITALGGRADGTARVVAASSALPEYPLDSAAGAQHLAALAERLALFGRAIRTAIDNAAALDDADTSDLYTEISRGVDKRLWFIEAHLQSDPHS